MTHTFTTSELADATDVGQTPVIPEPESSVSLFRRFGSSLLLFSFVFSALLTASWTYVLPRLTRIQLQGQVVDLSVVLPYENKLKAEIAEAEAHRNVIVMPVNDKEYDILKRRSICYPLLEELTVQIGKAATTVGENAVVFSAVRFDSAGNLVLEGDVRNVGPRSMTVLAQFTEALREVPSIESVVTPSFNRQNNPAVGFHSPFTFTIQLKPSDACPSAA